MLSLMPKYGRRNDQNVIDHYAINQWPQDEISILNGNCSFHVDVIL